MTDADMALVRDLCSGFSQTEVIPEHLMDVVTAVSGSSPAYVFMFIEAMADAAVAGGMPRQQAYKFAAQAVLGSAKMVLGRENIRENSKIWYALRQEPPFRQCVCWRKKACAAA